MSKTQCRSCNKTYNFITKLLLYDEASGMCRVCLNEKLATFAQSYRARLLESHRLPKQEEIREVAAHAQAIGIQPAVAFQHVKSESIDLLQRVFVMAKDDGIIEPKEEQYLLMLQRELYLHPDDYAAMQAELEYIKIIQQIREGNPPIVRPSIILPSAEICYWDTPVTYHKVLTASVKQLYGNLILTDKKVRFVSLHGGFEFLLSKIAAVNYQHPGGINLQLTRAQGNGYYAVQNGEMLCEILSVILNKHNRRAVYKQAGSRTIPQEVKSAVWQRDSGKCVQCGAAEYLEYDHNIPFSRGGASTVNNVQLLCRRCNLAKSDKI